MTWHLADFPKVMTNWGSRGEMVRTFSYRIYPTGSKLKKLEFILNECTWLWNYHLDLRVQKYENGEMFSLFDMNKNNLVIRESRGELKSVPARVLQEVNSRLDRAFRDFYRRTAKFPRKKEFSDSFSFPAGGYKFVDNSIDIYTVGLIRVKKHREPVGVQKKLTIKREPTGKWFIHLVCIDDVQVPKIPIKSSIGIDFGIKNFLTLSDGRVIENPHFIKKNWIDNPSPRKKNIIATKIENQRNNWFRHLAIQLFDEFDQVIVEDINLKQLKAGKNPMMKKLIRETGWHIFVKFLEERAEKTGKTLTKVNPFNTTQNCSGCGKFVTKTIDERIHQCSACGLTLDRDLNAAINIFNLGRE